MGVVNIIIITFLILVLLWVINKWFFRTNVIYDIICDANEPAESDTNDSVLSYMSTNKNVIKNKDFNENNTSNFMLSLWFYVDNWGNSISIEKNILYISNKSNSDTLPDLQNMSTGISKKSSGISGVNNTYKNLNICLDKYENNLIIDIETYLDSFDDAGDSSSNFTRYVVKNVPIQKWNNLTLSVDTKTFDVYLDGKLRNSFILHGVYKNKLENSATKNIYLGNLGAQNKGFEGFITRIRYEPNSINPQEAYNIYKAGINSSLVRYAFNKYSLKVSFLEYNKERGSFRI